MNNKKIIVRLSNELGNQMFMYASALGISNRLNRELIIDNESAFTTKKNISKYGLNNFNISSKIATKKEKFLGKRGYIKRKFLKKFDVFKKKKRFYIEPKNHKKITSYNDKIFDDNFADVFFLEGYFETAKYFTYINNDIIDEFNFLSSEQYKKSPFFNSINDETAVSICIRQNRFSEGLGKNLDPNNLIKSDNFTKEQINYVNKSITYFNQKLINPKFYLWSNNLNQLDVSIFDVEPIKVIHSNRFLENIDKRCLDLFLLSQCKNHIVIPSSFNWWGAWLSQKKNKIILRPSGTSFSTFKVNNNDFWPSDWVEVK